MDNEIKTMVDRSNAYRLLAACFYEPEPELFREEKLSENLAQLMRELSVPAEEPCRKLGEALEGVNQDEMLVEYSALFLGPFEIPAIPYASVYLEKGRRLMGDSSMAVKKLYKQAGVAQEVEGPPDHIALELEFMNFLLLKQVECRENGNGEEEAEYLRFEHLFLSEFLAGWMVPFANAIREGSKSPFYLALADLLVIFVSSEVRRIEQAAEELPAAA